MTRATLFIAGLLLLATTLRAQGPGAPAGMAPERDRVFPSIVVTGRGEVSARPDRATVRLGAMAQANDAATAQAHVNDVMTKALAAIKALGIPEAAIQTAGLDLQPIYGAPRSAEDHEPRITGFQASNVLQVRVDDLTKIGPVIDAGVAAGANQIQGVSFSLKDDLPQRQEALAKAAREARSKAQAIAQAMGLTLGSVLEIIEEAGGPRPFAPMARMAAMEMGGTPVQPGEVDVAATLTVRFRIGDK